MVEQLKDKLLDGRWKYLHMDKSVYVFENIYNHSMVKLSHRQINQVLNGKDTISHIQCRRIGQSKRKFNPNWWCNGINKKYAENVKKYKK